MNAKRILRVADVMMLTGLKRSTIYLWASEGRFPRQFKIGNSRASGWAGDEVAAWIESRVQEGLARRDSESAEAA